MISLTKNWKRIHFQFNEHKNLSDNLFDLNSEKKKVWFTWNSLKVRHCQIWKLRQLSSSQITPQNTPDSAWYQNESHQGIKVDWERLKDLLSDPSSYGWIETKSQSYQFISDSRMRLNGWIETFFHRWVEFRETSKFHFYIYT